MEDDCPPIIRNLNDISLYTYLRKNIVNQKPNFLSLKNILRIWVGLTVLIIIYGLLTFTFDLRGKTFIVMLNVLNILLFSMVYIFRKKIEKAVTNVLEQSKDLSISI